MRRECEAQAWYCVDLRDETKTLRRWCSTHSNWEPIESFQGFYRTCQGRKLPDTGEEAAEAARMAASVAEHADAQMRADAAADAPVEPVWRKEWGRQSVIVDGQDACEQLKSMLGDGVKDWVHKVRADHPDCDEEMSDVDVSDADVSDETINATVKLLYDRISAQRHDDSAVTVRGTPIPPPPVPTTCAVCGKWTCPAGFVGKSMCMACSAGGKGGMSLVDVNHALVTGHLYGKGALPREHALRSGIPYSGIPCGSIRVDGGVHRWT